ncbi:SMAD/FHA domain-containing protein [Armillaria mellea]|nr:SMAD/FHA domain-containing protein [Armillaria mellea]
MPAGRNNISVLHGQRVISYLLRRSSVRPCLPHQNVGEMTIPMTRIAADDGTVTTTPKDGITMVMSDARGKENRIGGRKMLIESMGENEKETETIHTDTDSRRSASPRRRRSGSKSRSASPPKAKPNFGASGLLAAETNTVKSIDGKNSTVLKYNEPPEARKPVLGWRLYVFKGSEQVELLHIQRQSAYLFGRDRLVADIPIDHPSCSKQHAVIQYRYIQEKNEFGDVKGSVKPFIIDLESTNGTHVNDEVVPPSRYYELRASDVIKFGLSTKEYVLLHDEAAS